MYDTINLSALLVSIGFKTPQAFSYGKRDAWLASVGLDLDECGTEYEPESLHIVERP